MRPMAMRVLPVPVAMATRHCRWPRGNRGLDRLDRADLVVAQVEVPGGLAVELLVRRRGVQLEGPGSNLRLLPNER